MSMSYDADIYDDLISRRVHTSDAEKFAEVCPCCTGVGWGAIWYVYVKEFESSNVLLLIHFISW